MSLHWLSSPSPEYLILGLVLLTLIAVRRARIYRDSRKAFTSIIIIVLCSFVVLMTAYVRGKNLVEAPQASKREPRIKPYTSKGKNSGGHGLVLGGVLPGNYSGRQ